MFDTRKESDKKFFGDMNMIDAHLEDTEFKTYDARILIDPCTVKQYLVVRVAKEIKEEKTNNA